MHRRDSGAVRKSARRNYPLPLERQAHRSGVTSDRRSQRPSKRPGRVRVTDHLPSTLPGLTSRKTPPIAETAHPGACHVRHADISRDLGKLPPSHLRSVARTRHRNLCPPCGPSRPHHGPTRSAGRTSRGPAERQDALAEPQRYTLQPPPGGGPSRAVDACQQLCFWAGLFTRQLGPKLAIYKQPVATRDAV